MTLYQKIKTVAEYGHYSLVETNDNRFMTVFPFADEYDDYRESYIQDSLEECMRSICDDCGAVEETWNLREKDGWKFVKAFALPHKYYEAGDKVDVMENARDLPGFNNWSEDYKEMVGQKGLVVKDVIVYGCTVYTKDNSDYAHFPHECLAPHIPEEDNKQVVQLKDGKKYLVQVLEEVE